MPWPTVAVITTGMDADTDALPRADILDHTNKFNQLIAMRGVADGVCDLDAGTLIPTSRLPGQLPSLSALSAQQTTDLRSLSAYVGTLLNDADAATARATLGAEPTLLLDYTVPAVTTSVAFSGLDINAHKGYRVEIGYVASAAAAHAVSIYVNALTTATDYYSQYVQADGGTVTSGRLNSAQIFGCISGGRTSAIVDIGIVPAGYVFARSEESRNVGVALLNLNYKLSLVPTVTNITSLTLAASVANGIDAGTVIRIYRKDK